MVKINSSWSKIFLCFNIVLKIWSICDICISVFKIRRIFNIENKNFKYMNNYFVM